MLTLKLHSMQNSETQPDKPWFTPVQERIFQIAVVACLIFAWVFAALRQF